MVHGFVMFALCCLNLLRCLLWSMSLLSRSLFCSDFRRVLVSTTADDDDEKRDCCTWTMVEMNSAVPCVLLASMPFDCHKKYPCEDIFCMIPQSETRYSFFQTRTNHMTCATVITFANPTLFLLFSRFWRKNLCRIWIVFTEYAWKKIGFSLLFPSSRPLLEAHVTLWESRCES